MKKQKKLIYVQDWGTYQSETIVAIGVTYKELEEWVAKNGSKKFREAYEGNGMEDAIESNCDGLMWHNTGYSILWMKEFSDSWDWNDTLMHECLHLIQYCFIATRGFEGEYEAQAYQQEYLVRSIRQKANSFFHAKK